MTGLHEMTDAEYHADPCEAPSLSSSMAKILLDQSPAHAWHAHPKLGGEPRKASAAMDHGSLIHRLVLGAGADVVPIDADDWRTKAAREARDEAREAGRIPVLVREHDEAIEAATAILANLSRQGVNLTGRSEVSCTWQESTALGPIWCRCRIDHLIDGPRPLILDLKSTRSANPKACARHVVDYGYDTQQAAYVRGLERVRPAAAGRVDFLFLFVELDAPYACTPARLDGMLRERGARRWAEACETWASCLSMNLWPGYATEPVRLEAPGWLASRMLEEAAE